ncbi:tail fiber protein [Escherichia coli]
MSSATNSTSETLAATPKAGQGCIRPGSRQGACQPHSPVESDNGSACGLH